MRVATHTNRPTAALPRAARRAMASIEYALAATQRELADTVGQALGFRSAWKPNAHLGDTATRISMWTQYELNAVYERVGGTVTTRPVQRSTSDGSATWPATEITLTVLVPDVGPVEIVTDWDEKTGGRDLPVMRAVPNAVLIAA